MITALPAFALLERHRHKLDYLKNLGINCIEIMPAFDFDTTTSMGYNTGLPYAMDNARTAPSPRLKSFIKAAHQHGIAVIFDVVYNHFGPQGLDEGLSRFDGFWVGDTRGEYFYDDVRIWTGYGDNRPDFGRWRKSAGISRITPRPACRNSAPMGCASIQPSTFAKPSATRVTMAYSRRMDFAAMARRTEARYAVLGKCSSR